MGRIFAFILIFCVMVLSPMVAFSQSAPQINACKFADNPELQNAIIEQILGEWQVMSGFGYVRVAGVEMPYPPTTDNDHLTFKIDGSNLIATAPQMQSPMVFHQDAEPAFAHLNDATELYREQHFAFAVKIRTISDCVLDDLPRFIGTTRVIIEGMVMNFTWRLTIVGAHNMFVVQDITGITKNYPFYSRRLVDLNRYNP